MKFISYTLRGTGKIILLASFFMLLSVGSAHAANVGDIVNFNVDKGFDINNRTQIQAILVNVSPKLYFYAEKPWWDSQTQAKRTQFLTDLDNLSNEFNNNIYPTLTSNFGSEWNPGIDNDSKITILFESMNSTEGGYFREADGYDKLQLPSSNEREMLYLSVSGINDQNTKVVLAHEFTHLITFNQKNKIFRVEEDTWLNEARADYSSTILGYDSTYLGSNLQQRVGDFVGNPSDSITDWSGTKYDYASVGLFTHYLVDHYGVSILANSLKSKLIGIESIDGALIKSGERENFAQIFTNWTIALAINDCLQDQEYCYSSQSLKDLKISPTLIFLPLMGDSSLSSTNTTKDWAGNWQKIIGGNGNLKLNFSSLSGLNFQVPYVLYDKAGNYSVKFLGLDGSGKGEIGIPSFGTDYKALLIIPSLQTKISGLENSGIVYPYSFTISITGNGADPNQVLIQKLLAQIDSLKQQIAVILAQRQGGTGTQGSICSQIVSDLYFGMQDNSDVKCLQGFLKNQGAVIYPEGLVTGNFGSLTKAAVIRFQEKYASDILTLLGLSHGTGYVGSQTRIKINQLLNAG